VVLPTPAIPTPAVPQATMLQASVLATAPVSQATVMPSTVLPQTAVLDPRMQRYDIFSTYIYIFPNITSKYCCLIYS
jgi:hypothetical protein